ncbi:AbrB/MazE/SpoVT family DNA-binding domain-containing protein [Pseudomonadota bacterium]
MSTATITSKGQVTIPASVRTDLKVKSGDRLEFVKVKEGLYEIMAATQDIQRLKGIVKSKGVVSIDEMNSAIRTRAAK